MAEWTVVIKGWHWKGPDGWEIIRRPRPEDGTTEFVIFHKNIPFDIRRGLSMAKLTVESEITRERLP
jgi:hypothetical protein